MAQSILDYIFRRLALDFLPFDVRADYGIYSAAERQRQLDTGSYLPTDHDSDTDFTELAQSAPIERHAPSAASVSSKAEPDAPSPSPRAAAAPTSAHSSMELLESKLGHAADAPLCANCGTKMRPAGSCYVCEGCGSTSGCS
jgi:ribonucleoside-diphosphate reductase alpha chain